jgi:pimeloyl-ACP methyl ester carboxylesterase
MTSIIDEHLASPVTVRRRQSPLYAFLLVLGLLFPFWVFSALTELEILPGVPLSGLMAVLMVVCPVTAAAILVYRQNRPTGARDLLKQAFDFKRIHFSPAKIAKRTILIVGLAIGESLAIILLNWVVWEFIPPIPTHQLAKDLGRTGSFISIQGIDTYYETHGTGSPLILIPPAADSTSTWRYNIPTLSKHYRVFTLDLPGSGLTGKPATFPYTHKAYAAFVKAFADQMGINKTAIGGQSLGAAVALEFSLDYPSETSALILIASGGYHKEGSRNILDYTQNSFVTSVMLSFSSYPLVVKSFDPVIYYNPTPFMNDAKLVSEVCVLGRAPNSREALYWMQKALNWDYAFPDVSRIRDVSVPTLIIWGKNDTVANPALANRFHQDIKGSQLVIIDKAGHMVHQEQPDEVNSAILAFLGALR